MAVKTYVKGTATKLSTNFKSTEFDCHGSKCCSSTLIDEKLVEYLQKIRDHFGKPVNISSGYRCATHNKSVGGVTGSRHMKGQAADIYIDGVAPAEIAKYSESIGVLGIGLYETNADGHFVHIDTRTYKSFWYGQAQSKRTTFGGAIAVRYRVRKAWGDAKSQIGAYSVLENAKNACDKAGAGYFVFDSKGKVVYINRTDVNNVNTSAIDPQKVWNFFKSKGLSEYGIAGLMGNLYAESGLRTCNLQSYYEKSLGMTDAEYTVVVNSGVYDNFVDDKAGYGLAQWTYHTRKQALLNYAKSQKKSIEDFEMQLAFLYKELSESYKDVLADLRKATSVFAASNSVLTKFERPADQSESVQKKRAEFGQVYYDKYATKPVSKIDTVKKVQSWANTNYNSGLVVDGIYGANTKKALVKILQTELNQTYNAKLVIDGIWGVKTRAACPTLRKGAKNDVVGVLQALLICNGYSGAYLDKDYGNATASAVGAYQRKVGLVSDRIAGKDTFTKLCG